MAKPHLVHAVGTADGRARGVFSDSSTIVLEPEGASFTTFERSGERIRQRVQFATSRFSQRVAQLFDVRNALFDVPSPWPPPPGSSERLTHLPTRATEARWPSSAADAEAWINSLSGWASVRLIHGGYELEVEFPLLLPPRRQSQASSEFLHRIQRQTFSSTDPPNRWTHAAILSLSQSEENAFGNDGSTSHSSVATRLPFMADARGSEAWGDYGEVESDWMGGYGWNRWSSCSTEMVYPDDSEPVWERTEEATIRLLPSKCEVEAVVREEGYCLRTECDGSYIRILQSGCDRLYERFALPEELWLDEKRAIRPKPHAERAIAFLNAVRWVRKRSLRRDGTTDARRSSGRVICEAVEEELGHFIAFEDGRVSARFTDCAVGELEPAKEGEGLTKSSVLLPDGTRMEVHAETLVPEAREYVDALLAFREWAFMPDRERKAALQEQRELSDLVDVQLSRCNRFFALIGAHPPPLD